MKNNNKKMLQSNSNATECNEVKQLGDVEKTRDKQELEQDIRQEIQQQIMSKHEMKFYKLLFEQSILIEKEKLLAGIDALKKKERIISKIKKRRSNDSTIEKNSKSIKELYKEA